jgi:Transmembrane domain of unknown function (DUF3566)
VDNRVEAPTWTPDGGSEDSGTSDKPSESWVPADSADSPAGEYATTSATGNGTDGHSSAGEAPAAELAEPPASSPTNTAPLYGAGGVLDPGSGYAPPTSAGQGSGSLGSAARGLAGRVSGQFAALTKPRPRPAGQPPKKPAAKPATPKPAAPKPAASKPATPDPTGGLPPARPIPQYSGAGPVTRRAQLKLDRIEPWSVMKFSFLMSLVGWVILFVAVAILYFVLEKLGVFHSIEHTFSLVTGNKSNPAGTNLSNWFRASRVLGYTMLVGAINVVLITALSTIGAVLYNLVTMLAGGVEVTLKESD